jgi:hypothetical protein
MTDINALANRFLAEFLDQRESRTKLSKICADFEIELFEEEFYEAARLAQKLLDNPSSPLISSENRERMNQRILEKLKKYYPIMNGRISSVEEGVLIDEEVYQYLKEILPADLIARITKATMDKIEKEGKLDEDHLLTSLEEKLGVSFFKFLPGLVKHQFTQLPDNQKSNYLHLLIGGLQEQNPGIVNSSFPQYFFQKILDTNDCDKYLDFLKSLAPETSTPEDHKLLAESIITDLLMALGYPQRGVDCNHYVVMSRSQMLAIREVYDHDWIDWAKSLASRKNPETFQKPESLFSDEFQKTIKDQLNVSFLFFLPVVIVQRTKNMSLKETMVYLSVLLTGIQSKYPDFAEEFFGDSFLDIIIGSKRNKLESTLQQIKDPEALEINRLIPVVLYDLLLAACHQPKLPSGTILEMSRDEINTLQKIWYHPEINFVEMLVNFNATV